MSNYFIETHTTNPWWNLAVEKYLADRIGPGDVLLYLWQNENTVVIGRNQNALRECKAQLLEEEGGFLARRTTGGGAVYHDLGNLCFTFAASPELYDLEKQMQVIRLACQKFGIETHFSGRNDILTEEGFKFSGNAFSVTSRCKIQHGTLMLDVDVDKLGRYLTPSKEKMKSKGIKSVRSRVCNLKALNPDITAAGMRQTLQEAFGEIYGSYIVLSPETVDPQAVKKSGVLNDELQELQKTYETYASWEWKFGKSPECEMTHSKRFDWGEIEIHLKLNALHISACKVYTDALDVELPELLEKLLVGNRYDCQDVEIEAFAQQFGADADRKAKVEEVIEWLSGIRE